MQQKRVTIEVQSNVRCRMAGADNALLKHLDEQLAEEQKGSEWAPNHRRFGGRWDGKKHHFCKSPASAGVGTFPKGLLSRVQTLCKLQDVETVIVDQRSGLHPPIDVSKLRPDLLNGVRMDGIYSYQLDAVKAALQGEAGVIYMATNAGKSEIASALIKVLHNRTILFVVPKAILLKQTRDRVAERLGTIPENIGVIGGGKFEPKDITIAIINSITPAKHANSARAKAKNVRLREFLKTVECVFLDEGHHAKANTWFRLMGACVNAQYRYLMSGTPFTGDNDLMVEAAAGPVLYEIRNDDLIKLGVSAKPRVRIITIEKPDLEGKDAIDDQSWHAIYSAGIVDNVHRNKVIAKVAADYSRQGKSVLILVRILSQGTYIRQLVASEKAPVEFAHGKMPASERDTIVSWFEEQPGRVLVGSNIFDEGVNIPQINALIIADGGKSLRAVLQKIGRSIRRKKEGPNVVDAVDFADCTHHWLSKHSLERYDIFVGEGFEIVEEDPTGKKEVADGRRPIEAVVTQAVPALLSEDVSGSVVFGAAGQFSIRSFGSAAAEGADAVFESISILRWRRSQIA